MSKYMMKLMMALHIMIYRLTGGRVGGEMRGFKVLLLTTTGRKSGKNARRHWVTLTMMADTSLLRLLSLSLTDLPAGL
jgi:hypothetical protein